MHARRFAVVLTLLFVFVGLAGSLYAAGGSCPSAANYLNPANPAGSMVTLSSLGVTSCYYIAANGSDSNNGTTESTPWLHAPGMPNCSATCASVTPAAGEGFIFRGGDTWHFGNSSATPYVGSGGWNFSRNGTSTAPIYIGVDLSWYSGSSWARPIFTGDNPLSTQRGTIGTYVSSCTYTAGSNSRNANDLVLLDSYNDLDDIEFTGLCWGSTNYGGDNFYVDVGWSSNTGWVISRNYAHGWTHTEYNSSTGAGGAQGAGFVFLNGSAATNYVLFNVIDGSDSDPSTFLYEQGPTYVMDYNVITYNQGGLNGAGCYRIVGNLFDEMQTVSDGSGAHTDVLQCYGETANGPSDPNLWYDNVFKDIPFVVGSMAWHFAPSGQTDYEFNEVYEGDFTTSGPNYIDIDQTGGPGGGNTEFFNNTMAQDSAACIICNGDLVENVTSINNHWVSTPATQSHVFQSTSKVTESTPLYMTDASATTDGYTESDNYAPSSATRSTVGAGSNETSLCNSFSDTVARAACLQSTTLGVSYNQTNHTAVYPGITPVPRPSTGAWDVGAYQFGSGNNVNPPTGLTATPH